MHSHTVLGGGGIKLHVREWGNADSSPILFIHGWSQHHLCWQAQIESPLFSDFRLVAMDLRGHGQSEAPLDVAHYTNGELWAQDVRNVQEALNLHAPILVGWSYAGFVIGDYLRCYGDGDIAGINFVCAAVGIGEHWFGDYIGPGFLDHVPGACSEDQAVALQTLRNFLHVAIKKPIPQETFEIAMGWNMIVDHRVRAHLVRRSEDFTTELKKLEKPVLVTYGADDTVVTPAMAKVIAASAPGARMSEYPGAAHAPFLEDAARFNAELVAFATGARQ